MAADGTPELAEVYSLSLTAVRTVSDDISEMGIAEFDSLATMATLTVRASDNPHGVVEFQTVQAQSEESSPVTLTVVREFGMIGRLYCVRKTTLNFVPSIEEKMLTSLTNSRYSRCGVRSSDGQPWSPGSQHQSGYTGS